MKQFKVKYLVLLALSFGSLIAGHKLSDIRHAAHNELKAAADKSYKAHNNLRSFFNGREAEHIVERLTKKFNKISESELNALKKEYAQFLINFRAKTVKDKYYIRAREFFSNPPTDWRFVRRNLESLNDKVLKRCLLASIEPMVEMVLRVTSLEDIVESADNTEKFVGLVLISELFVASGEIFTHDQIIDFVVNSFN